MHRGSQRLFIGNPGPQRGPHAYPDIPLERPPTSPPRRTPRKEIWLLIALLTLPLAPGPAMAQEFGQWTWEALLGLGGRNRDNFVDGKKGGTYDERTMDLFVGINGFVFHPSVSRLRLGLNLEFITTDTGQSLDTDRIGLRGDFELFPRGPYRGSVYFNRQFFDYSGAAVDDPYTLFTAPDGLTNYGARFRAGRGFLGGSLLGLDRSRIDFLETGTDQQVYDREFFDWSRDIAGFSNHLRIEHRYRELGTVDVVYDELRVNLDENGDFSPTWHWNLTASGIRQESESFGLNAQRVDDYQLRSRLTHDVRARDLLEFFYEFGLTEPDTRSSTGSHGLSVSYKWRPNRTWHIGPIVSYAQISSDPERIRSPRVGVVAGADWDRQTWNSGFVARASYGLLQRDLAGMTQEESQAAGSLIGTLGHGDAEGLRKEFEVQLIRNRLQVTQRGLITPPGLGIPLPGLGTEDVRRARITLGHRWDSRFLNAWGDWNHRETSTLTSNRDIVTETLTATLQYGARRFDLKANIADTDVEEVTRGSQSIRTLGMGAVWRPSRTVSLRGTYRFDDRRIDLAPDIEGTQVEAGVRWQVGLFYLDFTLLETTQSLDNGPDTTLRFLTWKISRRFGGWLPIVTGPGRRGVIR